MNKKQLTKEVLRLKSAGLTKDQIKNVLTKSWDNSVEKKPNWTLFENSNKDYHYIYDKNYDSDFAENFNHIYELDSYYLTYGATSWDFSDFNNFERIVGFKKPLLAYLNEWADTIVLAKGYEHGIVQSFTRPTIAVISSGSEFRHGYDFIIEATYVDDSLASDMSRKSFSLDKFVNVRFNKKINVIISFYNKKDFEEETRDKSYFKEYLSNATNGFNNSEFLAFVKPHIININDLQHSIESILEDKIEDANDKY